MTDGSGRLTTPLLARGAEGEYTVGVIDDRYHTIVQAALQPLSQVTEGAAPLSRLAPPE